MRLRQSVTYKNDCCLFLSFWVNSLWLIIPHCTMSAGYYGFTLDVRLSVIRLSTHFSFPNDNLSKHEWIFIKLDMCIDFVEIWFGIANEQTSSNFYETGPYFCFRMITWINVRGFSPSLVCALILCSSSLGLLMGKFRQILTVTISACDTPIFLFSGRRLE